MSYDNELTYSDNVFLRAVELGCYPKPARDRASMSAPVAMPWVCGCTDHKHMGEHGIITWSRLGYLERAAA